MEQVRTFLYGTYLMVHQAEIMEQKNFACGIGPAFGAVGGKWKAIVLWELSGGRVRFGEFKRRIAGISEKMLVQQLRELERDGLVIRHVRNQVPPFVEYELSAWGVSLNAALAPIADWGEAYAKAHGRYPHDRSPAGQAGSDAG